MFLKYIYNLFYISSRPGVEYICMGTSNNRAREWGLVRVS